MRRPGPFAGSAVVLGFLLVLLTFFAYLPVLRAGFIWDDDWHVTENRTLRSLAGLGDIWFSPSRPGHITTPQYYPFTHTTFWVEHHLWGNEPLGYHFDNLLLHAASALLLWRILFRLNVPGAWLGAALWAIHPLNVESVAWVTERKNVLSGLLYLASFATYLRFAGLPGVGNAPLSQGSEPLPKSRWRWYALSFLCFLCALWCKTVASTLPAAVLLVVWWKRGRIGMKDVLPLVPYFIAGGVLGFQTSWMERHVVGAAGPEWSFSRVDRVLIASRAAVFYVGKLLFPFALSFNYERWTIDPSRWWQWLFPVVVLMVFVVLVLLRNRVGRGPLVAWLFFLGTLAPALGFFDVYPMRYSFVADHFQYLAGIGVLALVAAAARTVAGRHLRPNQVAVAVIFLLTLATLTFARARAFYSSETLWRDTLVKNPGSWLAHANLAKYYGAQGQPDRALEETRAVLSIRPDDPSMVSRLAMALAGVGDREGARREHLRAIALAPGSPVVHYNFGQDLARWGEPAEAEQEFVAALGDEDPAAPSGVAASALNNLATVQLRLNKLPEAEVTLRKLLALTPDNANARNTLAALLLGRKDLVDGEREARRAVRDDPSLAEAHNTLGNAFLMEGRLDEAIAEYEAALRRNPELGQARRNLEKAIVAKRQAADGAK